MGGGGAGAEAGTGAQQAGRGFPGGRICLPEAHALGAQEVLNRILRDIEAFVQPLRKAQATGSAKKSTKKQGKKKPAGQGGERR